MEDNIHEWCLLEYLNIAKFISPEYFYITKLSPEAKSQLSQEPTLKECHLLTNDVNSMGIETERICLLDPASNDVLMTDDAEKFEYFLFGGILGDDPPKDRTSELRQFGFPTRHLGPLQMTTDTALIVTKKIIEDSIALDQIPFIDFPEIKFDRTESVIMPFRYITIPDMNVSTLQTTDNQLKRHVKPLVPSGMIELLKKDGDMVLDMETVINNLPEPGEILTHDFRPKIRSNEEDEYNNISSNPTNRPIKCLQWNVERNYRASKIIKTLKELDPDIALIQEIDIGCARSERRDHFREIARELKWMGVYVCEFFEIESEQRKKRDQGGGVHGNAIFTKYDIVSFRLIDHKYHPFNWERDGHKLGEPRRGRLDFSAEVKTPFGPPILCYCVHLEVFCGITGRIAQFSEILSDATAHMNTHPYQLIFGDLNTMSRSIARLSHLCSTDQYRILSLGTSESVWWDKYLLSWHVSDGESNLLLESRGLGYFSSLFKRNKNNVASNSSSDDNEQLVENAVVKKTLSGFTTSVLRAARNPGFYDPWNPERDITLHLPKYFGLYRAKLDWTLVRGFDVVKRWMGNHDYNASDHKYLMVALEFDLNDNDNVVVDSEAVAKQVWSSRRKYWAERTKRGWKIRNVRGDEEDYNSVENDDENDEKKSWLRVFDAPGLSKNPLNRDSFQPLNERIPGPTALAKAQGVAQNEPLQKGGLGYKTELEKLVLKARR
ncbi:9819_t:CDS:2 [Ambispora leptoticha]|uniref:9819_t:CDS:1 n=1 Tax=Ambispora leptoticha TaxID=144679 RepID=A0A9N9GTU3_9GLOM|nr:9819_t:CDS:2 [Ambispora leptoticha]